MTNGDLIPSFSLPANNGETVSEETLKGQWSVLYFYPKDDTPGCTKQAIGFSERLSDFESLGAKVYGVSKDTITKHEKFAAKHDLTVTLISDEEGGLIDAMGSWVEKSMYGKTYMGIDRSTFIVGPDLKIYENWRKVKVAGHVDKVLESLRNHVNEGI